MNDPAVAREVHDRILAAHDRLERALLVGDVRTVGAGAATRAALTEMFAELRRDPTPAAIWFVDRPIAYAATERLWPMRYSDQGSADWPRLICWNRAAATPEEWARVPWWAAVPGVWVEYSDGEAQYLLHVNHTTAGDLVGDTGGMA